MLFFKFKGRAFHGLPLILLLLEVNLALLLDEIHLVFQIVLYFLIFAKFDNFIVVCLHTMLRGVIIHHLAPEFVLLILL